MEGLTEGERVEKDLEVGLRLNEVDSVDNDLNEDDWKNE